VCLLKRLPNLGKRPGELSLRTVDLVLIALVLGRHTAPCLSHRDGCCIDIRLRFRDPLVDGPDLFVNGIQIGLAGVEGRSDARLPGADTGILITHLLRSGRSLLVQALKLPVGFGNGALIARDFILLLLKHCGIVGARARCRLRGRRLRLGRRRKHTSCGCQRDADCWPRHRSPQHFGATRDRASQRSRNVRQGGIRRVGNTRADIAPLE
jgi:hypothetical protein